MNRHRMTGASIVELVIAIAIIAISIAGVLQVFSITTSHSADAMVRKQILSIAGSMLNEIRSKDFSNPAGGFTGAATQANRKLFDNVSDYHGLVTTGAYLPDGALPITGLEGYNVSVIVDSTATLGSLSGGTVARIDVAVTHTGTGEIITLVGHRTAYDTL